MKACLLALTILLLAVSASCQTTSHAADLTWTASTTPAVTYNVYQAPGLCSANASFVKIGNTASVNFHVANLPAKTSFSWIVKATDGVDESLPTNCSDGTTGKDPIAPPGSLTVIVK